MDVVAGQRAGRAAGIAESVDPAHYLQSVLGNRFEAERVDAFLEGAPAMVDLLIAHGFRFEAGNGICDIYGDLPGAGTGGRSLIAAPFNARALGDKVSGCCAPPSANGVRLACPFRPGPILSAFLNATRKPAAFLHVARRMMCHRFDLATHRRAMTLRNGVALVARLFELGERHGVRWLTSMTAARLI